MNIEILYEDNDIIVCAKPAGIAVQSSSVTSPDMETILRTQILRSGSFKNKSTILHVIHRLDQPVEGIIVFGRTRKAAADLSAQVKAQGDMNKTYLAVAYGSFTEDEKEGELQDYIYRDTATKKAVIVDTDDKNKAAKKCLLSYKVISEKCIKDISENNVVDFEGENVSEKISLVEIKLETGRYHQIRAQFSNAGHPLLGDRRYCSDKSDEASARLRVKNVALCAYKLSFKHPVTHKIMDFEVKPQGNIFKEF
ncbi:RluA family pseudouridine synthase [Butyrivibrio sp. AC2005]|uniref:RluA family pseudouridine synthase n=1 Tax=Butyrivibrio sp. AC2005 TaxID=1280672 RepID=UPI0003FD87AB|nr:RluA family pseudouridine synthase [Butyrivibrio sp. AC2005]